MTGSHPADANMRRTSSSLTGPGPSAAIAPSNGAWMPWKAGRTKPAWAPVAIRKPSAIRSGR